MSNPVANQFNGVCELDNYSHAISFIIEIVDNPHFYVFSDDIQWCMTELELSYPFTIVNYNYAGWKFGNYFYLMTLCKHFIIPNSTFGWWSAWLCVNPTKIVIAPDRWLAEPKQDTRDLIPASWIRL